MYNALTVLSFLNINITLSIINITVLDASCFAYIEQYVDNLHS